MNQVATQDNNRAVATNMDMSQQTLSSNNVLPYVLLLQGLSEIVMEGKGTPGQIVRSTNSELLGDVKNPCEFIPLAFKDTYTIQEEINGKFEYLGVEPRTAANQDAPYEFTQDGIRHKRIKCFNVFALLKKDIEVAAEMQEEVKKGGFIDPDKALLPVVITFRSSSFSAGKGVSTYFSKAKSVGSPPYVKSMLLSCHQEKNEKGTFFVYDTSSGTMQDAKTIAAAKTWYDSIVNGIQTNSIVTDEQGANKVEENGKVSKNSKF